MAQIPHLGCFGDKRLRKTGDFLMRQLTASGVSPRSLGGNRAGEVRLGRFLENRGVSVAEMAETARKRLLGRVEGRHILAIRDTASLRDDGQREGCYLHPTIAADAEDGSPRGLLSAEVPIRDGASLEHRNKRTPEAKESHRWVHATEPTAELQEAGAARVTMLANREARAAPTSRRSRSPPIRRGPNWPAQCRSRRSMCSRCCTTATAPRPVRWRMSAPPRTSRGSRPSAGRWKARPSNKRTPIHRERSPARHGYAPGSAVGQGITVNRGQSSWSEVTQNWRLCSMVSIVAAMCESGRVKRGHDGVARWSYVS